MAHVLREGFVNRQERKAAWLEEVEFVDTARALKALMRDLGHEDARAIDEFALRGIDAALCVLAQQTGGNVVAQYQQHRLQLRAAID